MYNTLEMHILEILSDDARVSTEQIAVMTGYDAQEVRRAVKRLEDDRVLVKYPAMINWERTDKEMVQAVIEVRVQPQRDRGFDAIAARIYQFEEVTSLYLMSGAYDLMVMVEAPTLKQLASFVSSKLSTLETVTGEDGIVRAQSGDTGIFIMPGYTFHATDALITNFHLPQSTLLMLISALMGREEALRVYREAVEERYRFFSFGDAMLIL